ncbi:wax ester/triacylglycerol synthase family O-acyltransferase [Streptomyces sp. ISL-94]|uniref:wax ester/triacylglycerol synthase family O-acyltransferase n=1 Tax=Streptomyces sp. ISL-94 TaxID=2819190 RepID=UPI001BEC6FF9|nr:wax ester/triacylglycerol synthase family O-acyltransferase [Streptomyces sp. ISL-94]MBT2481579.1 wax ester/triacylglycerol synthase family O-acyltransferase [Streptomyces sp. ISL-94]
MATEHLSPLDLAFWRIESSAHPMHLGALAVFTAAGSGAGHAAGSGAAEHAAELLTARCAAVPGLRRRIRDVLLPVGAAAWSPDPHFDPARHVFLVRTDALDPHAAAGPLMARPLDRDLPPWEAHVLAGPDPESFAVLFKFHHALADGLGALALAAALFDEGPSLRTPPARPVSEQRPVPGQWAGSALRRLPGAFAARVQDVGQALEIGAAVARAGLPLGVPAALTADAAGPATRTTAGLALDLDEVNLVRKGAGGTVNDVLIALVAGALRRWLAGRGDPEPRGPGPRALIPVSRRRGPGGTAGAGNRLSGNRLSGYLLRLPLAEPDPLRRLDRVRVAMDRNKDAGPARGAGAVALLADHVHPLGHRLGGPLVAQAARLLFDILVTSVPLPGLTFSLGGSRVREVYPLAPLAAGQSLAVAVSTYKGTVHYGLVADASAVPDLTALAGALRAELDGLVREVS